MSAEAVALETAVEITYPVQESTSSGIIFGAAVGIYCLLPFLVISATAQSVLMVQTAIFASMTLLLATGLRPQYRRQAALKARGNCL